MVPHMYKHSFLHDSIMCYVVATTGPNSQNFHSVCFTKLQSFYKKISTNFWLNLRVIGFHEGDFHYKGSPTLLCSLFLYEYALFICLYMANGIVVCSYMTNALVVCSYMANLLVVCAYMTNVLVIYLCMTNALDTYLYKANVLVVCSYFVNALAVCSYMTNVLVIYSYMANVLVIFLTPSLILCDPSSNISTHMS